MTIINDEESSDIENNHLALKKEKHKLTQNSQLAANFLMLEDKVMKIPDKNKSTRQPSNNVHFIKKINGLRVKNEQAEFLITWLNFPHSESTYEPEESILHKQNIKSFFEEGSQKRTQYIKNVGSTVQFC